MSCVILLVQFEGLQPKKKPNPKPCNTKNWRLNRARLQVRAVILPRHFWGDQARGPALLTAISLLRDSSVPQGRATGGGRRRGQTGTLGAERQTGTLGADRQGPSGQMSLYACWRWGGGEGVLSQHPFPACRRCVWRTSRSAPHSVFWGLAPAPRVTSRRRPLGAAPPRPPQAKRLRRGAVGGVRGGRARQPAASCQGRGSRRSAGRGQRPAGRGTSGAGWVREGGREGRRAGAAAAPGGVWGDAGRAERRPSGALRERPRPCRLPQSPAAALWFGDPFERHRGLSVGEKWEPGCCGRGEPKEGSGGAPGDVRSPVPPRPGCSAWPRVSHGSPARGAPLRVTQRV